MKLILISLDVFNKHQYFFRSGDNVIPYVSLNQLRSYAHVALPAFARRAVPCLPVDRGRGRIAAYPVVRSHGIRLSLVGSGARFADDAASPDRHILGVISWSIYSSPQNFQAYTGDHWPCNAGQRRL